MSIISSQYVIQAPIGALRSFMDGKTKQDIVVKSSPQLKILKKLLTSFHEFVIENKAEVFKISTEDAKNILKDIQNELKIIPELDRSIRNFLPISTQEKEVVDISRSLWFNLLSLIDDIKMIAHQNVDENAPDYDVFLSNMIAESINVHENKRFIGQKKLFALLD